MATRYALLLAVERYQDGRIVSVQFAEADATELAGVLGKLGIDSTNTVVLLSEKATKAAIESKVRRLTKKLKADDTCFVFFAGHGFSKNGKNYITCHDTQLDDLQNTSIPLQEVFSNFKATGCKHVVLFLDSCESGMDLPPNVRAMYSGLSKSDLEDFLEGSSFCICFASCQTGESSYSASLLGHGVWTYHLVEALDGRAPDAHSNGLVTALSLQNHLAMQVPFSLKKIRVDPVEQTPWMVGGLAKDFIVADVSPILAARAAAKSPIEIKSVAFRTIDGQAIKSLSGFKKGFHNVPKYHSDSVDRFVGHISESEVEADLDKVRNALKEAGYRRRDIATSRGSGSGSLVTKDFEYEVTVAPDPESLSEVLWRRTLKNVSSPAVLDSAAMTAVFENMFDTVEVSFETPLDIEDLIDKLEGAGASPDYPADASSCILKLPASKCSVEFSADGAVFKFQQSAAPKTLLESTAHAQRLVAASYGVLPPPAGGQVAALPPANKKKGGPL